MENTNTRDIYPEKTKKPVNNDSLSGSSLDEIYHEATEQDYIDRLTSKIDYYMMQKQEGLI